MSRLFAYAVRLTLTAILVGGVFTATSVAAEPQKTVAITTIVDPLPIVQTRKGITEGLAEEGFVEGKNLKIEFLSANGNIGTLQQIIQRFKGERPDLVMPITTPAAQAAVATIKDIPIVFATVVAPLQAKIVPHMKHPGGHVTGVSDFPPVPQQVALFRELMPKMKKMGYLYNPSLASSVKTLEVLRSSAAKVGLKIVTAPAPNLNAVIPALNQLIGKVDAIYVPDDTTVVTAMAAIVKVGEQTNTPVFAAATGYVKAGAAASIGIDYDDLGRIAGRMAGRVLKGEKPGDINAVYAYQASKHFGIAVNLGTAKKMGLTIPKSVISRASEVIK